MEVLERFTQKNGGLTMKHGSIAMNNGDSTIRNDGWRKKTGG
jgi:hypothetical protein